MCSCEDGDEGVKIPVGHALPAHQGNCIVLMCRTDYHRVCDDLTEQVDVVIDVRVLHHEEGIKGLHAGCLLLDRLNTRGLLLQRLAESRVADPEQVGCRLGDQR